MDKDVIIALDFGNESAVLGFLEKLGHLRPYVKVGMELYYAEGPRIVRKLKNRGHKVFLDLKLHDIPNTVKGAVCSIASLGADMINLHAAGGSAMMRAGVLALGLPKDSRPLIIAVTQLTSTSETMLRDELLINAGMEETVSSYAKNASDCGLDGVVCSPAEVRRIKSLCGDGFLTITPGIRFEGAENDDQSRVTTPKMAEELGSDYIVVGRPITRSDEPLKAYERCLREFCGGYP